MLPLYQWRSKLRYKISRSFDNLLFIPINLCQSNSLHDILFVACMRLMSHIFTHTQTNAGNTIFPLLHVTIWPVGSSIVWSD